MLDDGSERVRIHAQLIDAATGFHLWAEQFDRRLDDLFALQDEVANNIIVALQVELSESERQRLAYRYTKSIAAYDYYLRGEAAYEIGPVVERLDARRFYQTAIDLDPDFALAYARLALTYTGQIIGAPSAWLDQAWNLAQRAMALDGSLPQVYVTLALVQGYRGRHDEAIAAAERAIALDPNYADGYAALATALNWAGRQDNALEAIGKAMRLNPRVPGPYLKDRLAVMMGGRTAEKLLLGSVSSGADDDIRQATALARAMVARWGMADEVGPVDLRQSEEHPFLGREIAQPRMFSQETAHEVDQAVRRLISEAEQRAAAILSEYRPQIEQLVDDLEAHETLDRVQIDACLGPARERAERALQSGLAVA